MGLISSGSSILAKERSDNIFPVSSSTQIARSSTGCGNRFDLGILDAFSLLFDLLGCRFCRNRCGQPNSSVLEHGRRPTDSRNFGFPGDIFLQIPFGGRLGGLRGFTGVVEPRNCVQSSLANEN